MWLGINTLVEWEMSSPLGTTNCCVCGFIPKCKMNLITKIVIFSLSILEALADDYIFLMFIEMSRFDSNKSYLCTFTVCNSSCASYQCLLVFTDLGRPTVNHSQHNCSHPQKPRHLPSLHRLEEVDVAGGDVQHYNNNSPVTHGHSSTEPCSANPSSTPAFLDTPATMRSPQRAHVLHVTH